MKDGLKYVLLNLAAPLGFYVTFKWLGAKPAIGLALVITAFQVIAHWIYRIKFSPIFIVASGFTSVFGLIDLLITNPQFFRLEPFAQNFLIGTVFIVSFFNKIPIAAWFASGLPERIRPEISSVGDEYLRKLTLLWGIYLYIKAAIFLYLAYAVDLGELVILRSLVGGGTLVIMFLGEIAYRKWLRK